MNHFLKKLILIAGISLIPLLCSTQTTNKSLTLEDIWTSRKFFPRSVGAMYHLNSGEHYAYLNKNGLFRNDYLTGNHEEVLVAAGVFLKPGTGDTLTVEDFSLSDDETKLLITSESEAIYRYSEKSACYVVNLTDQSIQALSEGGKQRLATFSPNAKNVAFVRDNNLFYKNLVFGVEKQLTFDGKWGSIINGSTDWVYEEELDLTKAFSWSPDGTKIAFYKFDETAVKEFTFAEYGELYPTQFSYKYPKAGEANSIITLYVYDLASETTTPLDAGLETDQYIPRIYWTHDSKNVIIFRLNRLQNKLDLLLANPSTGKSHVAWTESNKYYVDITDNFFLLNDNIHFLWLSERDGYNHVWKFALDAPEASLLTAGGHDVISIAAVDEKNNTLYYTAAAISPKDQELYSVRLNGTKNTLLSVSPGITTADFTKNFNYYISRWSDANTPPLITLCDNKGKVLRELENNQPLREKIKEYQFSPKEFFTIVNGNEVELNAWMIKPPDFDATKKYPVLMYVYGGPNSQSVKNNWGYYDYLWYQMLAQKGYVVVSVDNRGTGARGEEFRKCTYRQLGNLETLDFIASAQYLASLPYVDATRIGIWGWSYGGYMTALCLTKGADVFKMGIAVAPVTNWRYYDNIYTERFMRTPQENPEGYDDNSPLNFASLLKGKILIIHGGSDDNVHMQNTMEMVAALVEENKQFEMQIYPNKNHSILGAYTRLHLYQRMTDYILRTL